jgi:Haem-NO-binding
VTRAVAKGSVFHTTLDFVRAEKGEAMVVSVLQRLPAEHREQIKNITPTQEVPFEQALALWEAVDAEIGVEDPGWAERSGAYSIHSMGVQLYSGILRKSSPTEFLTQRISLFRLYYHPGDMEVVEQGEGHAVLRLVGFDNVGRFFCRRQTGGLSRALEVAGGQQPKTSHVRCAAEGDAFCEWELTWA